MLDADSLPKAMRWYRIDLHLHTPGSEDYAEKEASYLDILKEAERRGLDIIAFSDHNTVAGYEALFDEIEFLERLEQRGRLQDHEREEMDEYRRLFTLLSSPVRYTVWNFQQNRLLAERYSYLVSAFPSL